MKMTKNDCEFQTFTSVTSTSSPKFTKIVIIDFLQFRLSIQMKFSQRKKLARIYIFLNPTTQSNVESENSPQSETTRDNKSNKGLLVPNVSPQELLYYYYLVGGYAITAKWLGYFATKNVSIKIKSEINTHVLLTQRSTCIVH